MGKEYVEAADEIYVAARDVMVTNHDLLNSAKVTFKIQFTDGGEDKEGGRKYGLVVDGHALGGRARRTTLLERACGMPDLTIELCGRAWDEMSPPEQTALFDQLFAGWEPSLDQEEEFKMDTAGRPVLVRVKPDIRLDIHLDVIRRRGVGLTIGPVIKKMMACTQNGQFLMDFIEDERNPRLLETGTGS